MLEPLMKTKPVNAPVHSVWCPCVLCMDWVASQPKQSSQSQ